MTEQEIKADLENRGIRLRTHMPDGTPIDLYDSRGGDYISIPVADYEKKIYDVVNEQPNMSAEQKSTIIQYFVYAMAVTVSIVDGVATETPYTNLTWQEYDVLYNGIMSSELQFISDPTIKVIVIEIPKMDDDTGERSMLYWLSLGLPIPFYTLFARAARVFKLLERS